MAQVTDIAPFCYCSPVDELPPEVFVQFFSWLDFDSIRNSRLVSKRWNACLDNPTLWKALCTRRFGVDLRPIEITWMQLVNYLSNLQPRLIGGCLFYSQGVLPGDFYFNLASHVSKFEEWMLALERNRAQLRDRLLNHLFTADAYAHLNALQHNLDETRTLEEVMRRLRVEEHHQRAQTAARHSVEARNRQMELSLVGVAERTLDNCALRVEAMSKIVREALAGGLSSIHQVENWQTDARKILGVLYQVTASLDSCVRCKHDDVVRERKKQMRRVDRLGAVLERLDVRLAQLADLMNTVQWERDICVEDVSSQMEM